MITSMVAGFEPVEVEWAEGTRVHCKSGKTYLDCFSGISVVNAGHRHPKVIAAAKAQDAEAFRAAMGGVGGGCRSCHKVYKKKKKK